MKIGKQKHEEALTETILDLENKGYKVIRTDGMSPTLIAVKDNVCIAIVVHSKTKTKGKYTHSKTITELEDKYKMFDKVDRVSFNPSLTNRKNQINKVICEYGKRGFNIIYLHRRCPDGIAIKYDKLIAVDVVGIKRGHSFSYYVKIKKEAYDIFDGVIVRCFEY